MIYLPVDNRYLFSCLFNFSLKLCFRCMTPVVLSEGRAGHGAEGSKEASGEPFGAAWRTSALLSLRGTVFMMAAAPMPACWPLVPSSAQGWQNSGVRVRNLHLSGEAWLGSCCLFSAWSVLEYLPVGGNAVQLECHRIYFFFLFNL